MKSVELRANALLTAYPSGNAIIINLQDIKDTEEVHKDKKYAYTFIKLYGSIGGMEYKVKERISEFSGKLIPAPVAKKTDPELITTKGRNRKRKYPKNRKPRNKTEKPANECTT